MPVCCPRQLGCNAPGSDQPCLLALCAEAAEYEPAAAMALRRWSGWRQALARGCEHAERRFHRRAYERARERAAAVLLMRSATRSPDGAPGGRAKQLA